MHQEVPEALVAGPGVPLVLLEARGPPRQQSSTLEAWRPGPFQPLPYVNAKDYASKEVSKHALRYSMHPELIRSSPIAC